MTADIIIVNFNTRGDLQACLRSLHDASPARLGEIVVVDNASSDGSAAMVRATFPAVRVIEMGENTGFARANNRGIRETGSPVVILLNSDTVVPPGALEALCARLEATGAAAAGPRLIDGAGRPELSWGPMLTPWAEWRQRALVRRAAAGDAEALADIARRTSIEREVDWVSGACLAVRRDAALGAGLIDERYFMYEEDVDFCAALRARGGRVLFTPAATITHLRGRAIASAPRRRPSHYDQSHLAFYRKHAPAYYPLLWVWMKLRGRI